ncbi:nucleotidyltransferase family protein [Spirosoma foliorum]|uniref:Nucleotidyltransferase domain-containing protein n=1 Tax=Spirosoma foliorum TaxID=2710596 RepID=A0A7G5GWG2_9BACT|nr:nucleotidyltransferase domain-containing protein [Spirosoma foliorum]QMW03204.1 nucleotidyltransferase domain-containing protein [Spirosoma foliorum]
MLHPYFSARLPAIRAVCQAHGVNKLYAFGSIVDGRFIEGKSDIDLFVELRTNSPEIKARTLLLLWIDLQRILNCDVDLLTSKCIRGKYFQKYLKLYKVLVFDYEVAR